MDCQGTVTSVNPTFLFFKLNNEIKVHMSILLTQDNLKKLPKVGSKVVIKNAHRQSTTYSVCNSSSLSGDFSIDYDKNFFYVFVKDYKLGFIDLLKIDGMLEVFDNYYVTVSGDIRIMLIQSILGSISPVLNIHCKEDVCLNTHMSPVDFITVSNCKHIEAQPETNKFINFPHWSFGIHSKPKEGSLLFGYLKVQSVYGFLMIKDDKYQIPCIIHNKTGSIQHIENSYVLIKKYQVITEIYKENNVPNIEYLIIDYNNINIIYNEDEQSSNCLFGTIAPTETDFKESICFQLIKKSMVCIGNKNKPECWLHILVKYESITPYEIFIILPSNYIKIVIYLEEGYCYKLFYNESLKQTQHIELNRIKKIDILELQESAAFFQKVNEEKPLETEKPLTVKECKEYVLTNTNLISFEGILKSRRFANALSSRTTKRTNIYGFGMPGSKVHQLVFSLTNETTAFLDCYLNNWENILMPLGLIPQMKLIVRNVYPQSKKYLKSSVFTTFEIVAYEPLINFETVNLYENDHLEWGRRIFLGQGNKIPHGVLVWGRVCNVQILSVKMTNRCSSCKLVNEISEPCIQCREGQTEFDFLVKMHVSDEFGQSKVLAKFPEIMKVLLDLREHQFEIWLKAFKQVGQYEYNFFEEIETTDNVLERDCFRNSLTEFLKTVNKHGMLFLDMKCRKVDCSPQKNGGRPLWFCIDARRS